jgi:hypothetical protein
VDVFGIAADGIRSVRLELADGSSLTSTVTDNAFSAKVTSDPVRASWDSSRSPARQKTSLIDR